MLKPPGKDFAKASVASTLCPACSTRVEHRTNYTVRAVRAETPEGVRTRLIANETLVIHACLTGVPGASNDEGSAEPAGEGEGSSPPDRAP